MEVGAAAAPAPDGRARRGDRAGRERDDLVEAQRIGIAVVPDRDAPPTVGRPTGEGDVAAQAEEDAGVGTECPGCSARGDLRGEGLPGRAQVELHAAREGDGARARVHPDGAPARHALEADDRAAAGPCAGPWETAPGPRGIGPGAGDRGEVRVVPHCADRAADRRVDQAVGGGRRVERVRDRAGEQGAHGDGPALACVEEAELAVRAEPAVGRVDGGERRFDRSAGGVDLTIHDEEVDSGPERAPACLGGHL